MEDLIMMYLSGSLLRWIQSRKLFATLSVIILFTIVLAACGGSSPATPSKYNGKISVGLDSDAVTLDPLKSSAFVDRQVMLNLYDTLARLDEHNNIAPDLATSWSYTSPTQK
jgi:peptide/nickel transport system substrate-binding protein